MPPVPSNGSDKNEFDFTPATPIDVNRTHSLSNKEGSANFDQTNNLPPDPFEEDLSGQIIGQNFRIIAKLGAGGMSVVYRAHNEMLKKDVAIKVLHPHLVSNRLSLERFRQEAQAASQIDHNNVVRIIDFGIASGTRPYIVMDYLEGRSLSDWIKSGPLELERSLDIFIQLADALSYAHEKSIIHRDLKPSNVIIVANRKSQGETAKIVDFGIAKLLPHEGADAAALTQTGDVFGSPLYMSPEQCKGEKLDNRSDIYSLGCLMYETLTGVPPINGANMLEILYRHMNEMPRSMKKATPHQNVPRRIEAIVFKALAKEPANRYSSMDELKEALLEFKTAQNHWINNFQSSWLLFKAKRRRSSVRDKIAITLSVLALLSLLCSFAAIGLLYSWGQDKPAQLEDLSWYSHFSEADTTADTIDFSSLGTRNIVKIARDKARKIREISDRQKLNAELGDPEELNSLLQQVTGLAATAFKERHYAESADLYENALTICRFVNGPESISEVEILVSLFRSEYYAGQFRKAIAHVIQLQNMNSHISIHMFDDNLGQAVLNSFIGDSYYRTGDIASARKYFYQAMEGWNSTKERDKITDFYSLDIEPICYVRYGDLFFKENLYKEALKYYKLGAACYSRDQDKREGEYNLALCSFKSSLCNLYLHEFQQSDKDFQQAVKLLKKHRTDPMFQQTLTLLYQINGSAQAKENRLLGSIAGFVEAGLQKFNHSAEDKKSTDSN